MYLPYCNTHQYEYFAVSYYFLYSQYGKYIQKIPNEIDDLNWLNLLLHKV